MTEPSDARAKVDTKGHSTAMILWVLWLTYGSFYFCRANLSVAVPGLMEEFDFTKAEIGLWILGPLKLAYGIGQLVNGQLAERFSPRLLLAIGMFGSAALNVLFGFGTALYFFFFVWACNGYMQAFGWTPTMRVAANWIPIERRGTAIGIIGTGYQLTAALTIVVAGYVATRFGWRAAMFVPALMFAASGVHMLLFLRDAPERPLGVPTETGPEGVRILHNIAATLSNSRLWLLAFALGSLNACRYGFLDWGMTHLKEVQDTGIDKAALKYAVLPLGGILGALIAGWATDRFFGGRRAPVIVGLLVSLGLLALLYNTVVHIGVASTMATLVAIGFATFGAQVLLVGTAPVDLARAGTQAAAVGFVNFMGYMGAYAGDAVTGIVTDASGWQVAVYFWSGCAFVAAGFVAVLWNVSGRSEAVA